LQKPASGGVDGSAAPLALNAASDRIAQVRSGVRRAVSGILAVLWREGIVDSAIASGPG